MKKTQKRPFDFKSLGLAVFSAVLLILSFPPFEFPFLIWFSLVPLLKLLDGKSPASAFRWGWLTGFLFFLGTHYWIIHATLPGMFLFNLYLGVYFGLFGLGYAYFQKVGNGLKPFPTACLIWALPALWVICEWARDRFLTGFGWACLGHSQYKVLPFIQIADITGVFGVSFVIVMVNLLIKEIVGNGLKPFPTTGIFQTVSVVIVLGVVWFYGIEAMSRYPSSVDTGFAVEVVQPNIPQARDMVMMSPDRVEERLMKLTDQVLKKDPPSLIIWPESAVPNGLWNTPERYERMKRLVKKHKIQLLFGAVTRRDGQFFNSAILLSAKGEEGMIDKRHLVPFGEFLPLRPWSNFIENYVPIGDFTRGKKGVLLTPVADPAAKFGVLVCFEDTVAPVVRESVLAGATWLVNITNDGWFQDSNEPHLHLASSVLQAVANRRTIIRSANTGVSSQIDSDGTTHILEKNGRSVMVEGTMTAYARPETDLSFYTRYGDSFTYFCVLAVLLALINRRKLL